MNFINFNLLLMCSGSGGVLSSNFREVPQIECVSVPICILQPQLCADIFVTTATGWMCVWCWSRGLMLPLNQDSSQSTRSSGATGKSRSRLKGFTSSVSPTNTREQQVKARGHTTFTIFSLESPLIQNANGLWNQSEDTHSWAAPPWVPQSSSSRDPASVPSLSPPKTTSLFIYAEPVLYEIKMFRRSSPNTRCTESVCSVTVTLRDGPV